MQPYGVRSWDVLFVGRRRASRGIPRPCPVCSAASALLITTQLHRNRQCTVVSLQWVQGTHHQGAWLVLTLGLHPTFCLVGMAPEQLDEKEVARFRSTNRYWHDQLGVLLSHQEIQFFLAVQKK